MLHNLTGFKFEGHKEAVNKSEECYMCLEW